MKKICQGLESVLDFKCSPPVRFELTASPLETVNGAVWILALLQHFSFFKSFKLLARVDLGNISSVAAQYTYHSKQLSASRKSHASCNLRRTL